MTRIKTGHLTEFVRNVFLGLAKWSCQKITSLSFGIPMIWIEPSNHSNDCYFCLVNTIGFNTRNKSKILYLSLPSAIRPVAHSDEIPVQVFTINEPADPSNSGPSISFKLQYDCSFDVVFTLP